MTIHEVSLSDFSSIQVGGKASLVKISSEAELVEASLYAKDHGLRTHILGEGTNTFFAENLNGILIIKNEIQGIVYTHNSERGFEVTSGAGELWDTLVKDTVEKKLWGLENLSYIPGTVGAASVQNIGAYGVELQDSFVSLKVYDLLKGEFITFLSKDCLFGYRDSCFKKNQGRYCIVEVTCRVSTIPKPVLTYKPLDILVQKNNLEVKEVRELVITTRKSKLPDYHQYPNCGSFFKNPIISEEHKNQLQQHYETMPFLEIVDGYKVPAAWLIEHIAMMKGVRVKDLGTWPQQPLVIVNYGESTASDIVEFTDTIVQKVEQETGIRLEREVNYIL